MKTLPWAFLVVASISMRLIAALYTCKFWMKPTPANVSLVKLPTEVLLDSCRWIDKAGLLESYWTIGLCCSPLKTAGTICFIPLLCNGKTLRVSRSGNDCWRTSRFGSFNWAFSTHVTQKKNCFILLHN